MIDIIERALGQQNIGNLKRDELKYKLERASIKKELGVLSIDITLNFVMPVSIC